jgi:phage-related protein
LADNFGLKIGVEGEREFKQAITDINQSFKVLGSEMQLVTSQFDKNDKSAAALTARNEVLNREIDQQKEKVSTLRAALDNAASSFGENDRRTQEWQIKLNKAEAELNGMERELGQNEKALEGVGEEMTDTAKSSDKLGDEVKDTGKEADDAGGKFDKLGSIVKGVGAAMGVAFAAVGAAAISAGKALTDMTVGASQYADNILTMSSVTGMSTDSLQAYQYAAELVDVSMETLTASMAKNVKSMSNAKDETKGVGAAYSKLGVDVRGSNGELRDAETVYWEAIDALGKISNETERDALAMQIFGKSARDLNPLIDQGSAGIAALTDEARSMGAIMSGDALDALGQFDDSMQRLQSGGAAVKSALGMVLLPQLQILADDGVGLLGKFTTGIMEANGDWEQISAIMSDTISGLVDTLMKVLPDIIRLGMDIVMSLVKAIVANLDTIVKAASDIVMTLLQGLIKVLPSLAQGAVQLVMALVNGIIENLPALLEAALQVVVTLATGIAEALPELIPALVETVMVMVQTLIDNMPMILDAALQLILGLVDGLLAAIPVLIDALPEIIIALVDFLISSIPKIIDAGIRLLTSLVEALPTIIKSIVEAIPKIIEGIINAVIGAIPLLIDAGIRLIVSLIQALPEIITTIVKAIPQIISGIINALIGNIDKIIMAGVELLIALVQNTPQIIIELVKAVPKIITGLIDAFLGLLSKFADIGMNIITGIWDGIKGMGKWLWDKFKQFIKDTLGWVADILGISSPSKVFRDFIGKNMMLGLAEGIDQNAKEVYSSIGDVADSLANTSFDLDADVGLNVHGGGSRRGSGAGAGGSTVTQNISITSPKALSEKEAAREFKNLSRKLALEY